MHSRPRYIWPLSVLFFLLLRRTRTRNRAHHRAADARDDQIRVYTEEVRLPVYARDEFGRFDPTLELDDIVVLEDNVKQQVRSIRRIPASVVLVLGAGGELNPAQRARTTREAALSLVSHCARAIRSPSCSSTAASN
jgi:hypothetical protein